MGKHRNHEKPWHPQPDDREMYQCEICKKRFPFEGYLRYADSKPFMFLVIADAKYRRFSLAVCMPNMQMTVTEERLWFVCSYRQCIYKSFLLWREWDRRKNAEAAFEERIGQVLNMVKSKGAAGLEHDLDEILRYGIIEQGKSLRSHNAPDEATHKDVDAEGEGERPAGTTLAASVQLNQEERPN
jgi:hypothetical protein